MKSIDRLEDVLYPLNTVKYRYRPISSASNCILYVNTNPGCGGCYEVNMNRSLCFGSLLYPETKAHFQNNLLV